jgi:hypothetical protein
MHQPCFVRSGQGQDNIKRVTKSDRKASHWSDGAQGPKVWQNDGDAGLKVAMAGDHGRHEDDQVGSVTAALARSIIIRKIILLPKLKAAALFQPEDHVRGAQIQRKSILRPRRTQTSWARRNVGRASLTGLHYGGIFASGTLLFVGQEQALRYLTGVKGDVDLDAAPPLLSGLAGCFGGALYSLSATPLANFLRATEPNFATLVRGLPVTLLRDTGGFGLYFAAYTLVRGTLAPYEGVSTESITAGNYHISDLVRRVSLSSFSGAAAAATSYLWRSPLDTWYKISIGARPSDTPLLSWNRFITSPRGVNAIVLGAATWATYEMSMLCVHRLHRQGLYLEALDEAAFTTWLTGYAYQPCYERGAENGGRWHGHDAVPHAAHVHAHAHAHARLPPSPKSPPER